MAQREVIRGHVWVLGACGIEGNDVGSMESSDLSCLIFMLDLGGAGVSGSSWLIMAYSAHA